jgi:DNA repair exonuclease SbcCD ATPase subunit
MDINQELSSVKNELNLYKDHCKQINAEKIALDQTFVDTLKSLVSSRKDIIIKNEEISELNKLLKTVNEKISVLQKEIEELKDSQEMLVVLDAPLNEHHVIPECKL